MVIHTQAYIQKKKEALSKTEKKCIHCKEIKPIEFYSTDRGHLDGKHPVCRECKKVEQRNLYKKQPERFRETLDRYHKKNREKQAARLALNYAVRTGKVQKPKTCQKCGVTAGRIEGHHHKGYAFPLDVLWLCKPCHCIEDLKNTYK